MLQKRFSYNRYLLFFLYVYQDWITSWAIKLDKWCGYDACIMWTPAEKIINYPSFVKCSIAIAAVIALYAIIVFLAEKDTCWSTDDVKIKEKSLFYSSWNCSSSKNDDCFFSFHQDDSFEFNESFYRTELHALGWKIENDHYNFSF